MGCCRCWTLCITGLYGCRWKRCKENRATILSENLWFCFLVFSVLLTFCNMYLWLVSYNEKPSFDWDLWDYFHIEFPFYFAFQTTSLVLFAYSFILLIFALLHFMLNECLHLNLLHKVLLILVDIVTTVILGLSIIETTFLWHFIPLSFMFFGPFFHMFAVIFMTIASWFVAGGNGTLQKKGRRYVEAGYIHKILQLLPYMQERTVKDHHVVLISNPIKDFTPWYFVLLIALYISPIFITSPCILQVIELPPKPKLFAHKGAENIAPENTLVAFQRAVEECNVYGFESDVRISSDGEHFCLHDTILARTTNIKDIFPDQEKDLAESFKMDELTQLNAGSWFLKKDPFGTVAKLTDEQRMEYEHQKIPTMTEMFDIAMKYKQNILFDLRPPPVGHRYEKNFLEYTVEKIKLYGINDIEMDYWKAQNGPHYVFFIRKFDKRKLQNVYNDVHFNTIREKREKEGLYTNVWTINQKWLFSLFWCAETFSVTTSFCDVVQDMDEPAWQLTRTHYLIMWIMFDVVSFIWVMIFFVCQIRRKRKQQQYSLPVLQEPEDRPHANTFEIEE